MNSGIYSLQQSVALDAGKAATWAILGDALVSNKLYADGIYALKRSVNIDATKPAVWIRMADAMSAVGDLKGVAYAHTRVVQLTPEDVTAWRRLVDAYLKLNDLPSAVYAQIRLVQLIPKMSDEWLKLADLYKQFAATEVGDKQTEQLKNAAYAFSRALELTPKLSDVWLQLGDTQRRIADLVIGRDRIAPLKDSSYAYRQALGIVPGLEAAKTRLESTDFQLASLLVGSPASPSANSAEILLDLAKHQWPNGAIVANMSPTGYSKAGIPYFLKDVYFAGKSLFWAIGTSSANGADVMVMTGRWLRWCFDNVDEYGLFGRYFYFADGSTAAPRIPTDADDAANAMVLAVLAKYVQIGGDVEFIKNPMMQAKIERIANVMIGLQQPNGLTWSSASNPYAYNMDNCEVFAGLNASWYIMKYVFHETAKAERYADAAGRVRAGILSLLYNTSGNGLFDWALGSPSDLSRSWYPDTISQVWPILFGVIKPDSPIARDILKRITEVWNSKNDPRENWTNRLDSSAVALAALMVGDVESTRIAMRTLAQYPYMLDAYPLYVTTIAERGLHLAMLRYFSNDLAMTATISAGVKDDGGMLNGGVDASAIQSTSITVTSAEFPLHNYSLRSDITDDEIIDIRDVLSVIYYYKIIPDGNLSYSNTGGFPLHSIDVVADNKINVLDILAVVYDFNNANPSGESADTTDALPATSNTGSDLATNTNHNVIELLAADVLMVNRKRRRL